MYMMYKVTEIQRRFVAAVWTSSFGCTDCFVLFRCYHRHTSSRIACTDVWAWSLTEWLEHELKTVNVTEQYSPCGEEIRMSASFTQNNISQKLFGSMLVRHMQYYPFCHVDGSAEPSASVLCMQRSSIPCRSAGSQGQVTLCCVCKSSSSSRSCWYLFSPSDRWLSYREQTKHILHSSVKMHLVQSSKCFRCSIVKCNNP